MPITKSAAKAMRQNIKHRRRNMSLKDAVKSEVKALQAAIAQSNTKQIAEKLNAAQSQIDKAAKAGVLHANKAARKKSQLTQMIKAAATKPAPPAKVAAKPGKPTVKTPAEAKQSETPKTETE